MRVCLHVVQALCVRRCMRQSKNSHYSSKAPAWVFTHPPAVAMATYMPSGSNCQLPLTLGNVGFTHATIIHTACCQKHTNAQAGINTPSVASESHILYVWTHASTRKSFSLYKWAYSCTPHTRVPTCTHTHPFPRSRRWLAPLFLAKNYMSFNVITGLTRTDSLCLLLCAGPPWERQTGACTEYLSNL